MALIIILFINLFNYLFLVHIHMYCVRKRKTKLGPKLDLLIRPLKCISKNW